MNARWRTLSMALLLAGLADKTVCSAQTPGATGGRLAVELRMSQTWRSLVIGPARAVEYPKRPGRLSLFMTGEMAGALLLCSQRVEPARLLETGFAFRCPDLETALRSVLDKGA